MGKFTFRSALFLLLLFVSTSLSVSAQDNPELPGDTTRPWNFGGNVQINFSQVALSNWQGGGQNTLAGAGFLNLLLDYKKGKGLWENRLDAGYGLIRQGVSTSPFLKSDDQLKFLSKYTHSLTKVWNAVVLADFLTTFMPGYKYEKDSAGNLEQQALLSKFMAPGYLITTAGLEYKPGPAFFVFVSPLSEKFTFVLDDSLSNAGAYGVTPGDKMRTELGSFLKSVLKIPIMKNVEFQNELNLFSAYKNIDQIDVNWIAQLSLKANDFLSARIRTDLIYDQDVEIARENGTVGPATQFKEVISIGIQYKFE